MSTKCWTNSELLTIWQNFRPAFYREIDVEKGQRRSPVYTSLLEYFIHAFDHALVTHAVMDPTGPNRMKSLTMTLPIVASIVSRVTLRIAAFLSFQKPFLLEGQSPFITAFVAIVVEVEGHCRRTPPEGVETCKNSIL